jgi:hypothetical protein
MSQPLAPIPGPPNVFRHPFRWLLRWLRQHWRQPNPHAESKLHRACRDFARHFRALRVQFPVFYLLGGVGAVAGGIVASSEHLDPLAIGEWSAVGLIGPPAIVCLLIFFVLRWKTPTKQRDEARKALRDKDNQIIEVTAMVRTLEQAREDAESAVPHQQISIETVERLELHGGAAERLTAQLIDRYELGEQTAASVPPREPQPRLELPDREEEEPARGES